MSSRDQVVSRITLAKVRDKFHTTYSNWMTAITGVTAHKVQKIKLGTILGISG